MPLRPLGPPSYSYWHPAWSVHHGETSATHVTGFVPWIDPGSNRHARRVLPAGGLHRAAGGLPPGRPGAEAAHPAVRTGRDPAEALRWGAIAGGHHQPGGHLRLVGRSGTPAVHFGRLGDGRGGG